MKYYIQIFGCQMNKSDAERVASLLDSIGYKQTDKRDNADLIVLVTCSVRLSAENRVYGLLKNIRKLKKSRPEIKTILTGCMAQQKDAVRKMKDVDIILNIKDLKQLPELLNKKIEQKNIESYFSIQPKYESSFTAYVPIMTGCNNFCTYCIVPYVRGREESRQPEDILNEVKELVANGYKEIFLLGQNVNSYKPSVVGGSIKLTMTTAGIKDFPDLLESIAKIKGEFWIRFLTSHPKDLSDKLIKVIAKNKKITEWINLPMQAGDNSILKAMNRKYTVQDYKKLAQKIRKNIPDVSLSTDIIVGFPGETKEIFEKSAKTFEELHFDMAYINQYSVRKGTAAAKLKDDVTIAEKKRRDKVLTQLLKKSGLENNKKLVGKTIDVLIDNKKGDTLFGKSRGFKVVKIKSDLNLLGKFVKVKIIKAGNFGLIGEYIKE